jgi:flagellar motor switch protein FliN
MADDQRVNQDDIEELLRQAQAGLGSAPASTPPPAAPTQPTAGALAQSELEALLKTTGDVPSPPRSFTPTAAPERTAPGGDVEFLLHQAEEALASINAPVTPSGNPPAKAFKFQDFSGAPASTESATLDLLRDVELDVKIELGRSQMYLEDVLRLRKGSVVALDKLAGDPVDIYVNGRLIARGEVLVLNDNFCVRVAELIAVENAA